MAICKEHVHDCMCSREAVSVVREVHIEKMTSKLMADVGIYHTEQRPIGL